MILPSGLSTYDYSVASHLKGWGRGWPNCGSNPTRTVTAKRSGTTWARVDVRLADLVEILLNEVERRGYLFTPGWNWGGACRPIAGTDRPSNHSYFIAIDMDAPKNPYTTSGVHSLPDWVFAIFRAYGFGLGADYRGARKDWMHAEFMGNVGDAGVMTTLARRAFVGVREQQAAPVPPVAPAAPVPPAAPAAPVISSGPTQLRRGSTGGEVRTLQQRLAAHGARIGVDGDFGPATEQAVRDFQSLHNLGVDGIVGPRTWAALNVNPAPAYPGALIREGSSGANVRAVQQRLVARGHAVGVDGQFGPRTAAAVRAFQKSRGLAADGIVGPDTWRALVA